MILQALYDYYQRKALDPASNTAPEGFEWKEIPFLIVIDSDGKFVTIEDTREGTGKARRAKKFLVTQSVSRTVRIAANLLWDNVEYAVQANPRQRADVAVRHADFIRRINQQFEGVVHPSLEALRSFLANAPLGQIEASATSEALWKEALETNANVLFRVEGIDESNTCDSLAAYLKKPQSASTPGDGLCLVSGQAATISRIHPMIKRVRDAQPTGAAIVSFNSAAYESYGKKQNHNAPIGEFATFAYTTALNSLLGDGSKNKMQVGDTTTVFWSDKKSDFEDQFASFFAMPPKDDPDRDVQAVQALYRTIHNGGSIPELQTPFFVLGLAPNAARISVRFWHVGTIAEFSKRIRQHFDDLEIIRGPKDQGRYALFWILVDIAMDGKIDNVPPNLAGNIVRAILSGAPYPATLIQQAVRRNRAEREVTRIRAAILKASLNRQQRIRSTSTQEITVALDLDNVNVGYRLGRLFAILEKIQEDAQPGINATIRERYYGAASSSPVTVFPQLLKLKNHHLAKLENPAFRIGYEKRLTEIIGGMPPEMPAHLAIDDQARFAIGYYHQRQALFVKADK